VKTQNILLISNNVLHREQLARLLNTLRPGCRCVATTGEQALAAVHKQRWDTLISDLEMGAQTRLSPSRLAIETTEDTAERFDAGLTAAISQLRLSDFNCAIDDYGTGFSSLQRLAQTPFSRLKIDQRFLHQAGRWRTVRKGR
jgi:predicted signal transduction protein with EAL and GGDEF domain